MAGVIYVSIPLETIMSPKLAHLIRITIGAMTFFGAAALIKSPEIDSVKYIFNRVMKKNNG